MITVAIIFAILFIMLHWFDPKIDKTRDGKVLLWYGRRKRKYIILKE